MSLFAKMPLRYAERWAETQTPKFAQWLIKMHPRESCPLERVMFVKCYVIASGERTYYDVTDGEGNFYRLRSIDCVPEVMPTPQTEHQRRCEAEGNMKT